jgi:hypothetical protein
MNIPIEYVEYNGIEDDWYKEDTDETRDFVVMELDFSKSHLFLN